MIETPVNIYWFTLATFLPIISMGIANILIYFKETYKQRY
jgi:hypothetical protein